MKHHDLFLSASRAYTFLSNKRAFIQTYVFGEVPSEKASWQAGTLIHELIYCIIRKEKIKECDGKRAHNKLRESGIFGVYGSYISAYNEIMATLPLIMDYKGIKKSKIQIETKLVNSEIKILGYPDILLPKAIIDLKTTSGDINKWERQNDLIRLGLQEWIYRKLAPEIEHLYFLVVEAVYPFRVEIRTLPDWWVESCGELFFKIQTSYVEWMARVGKIVCEITGHSEQPGAENFWLKNEKNNDFKTQIYEALSDKGHITLVKESVIPIHQEKEMDLLKQGDLNAE